MGERARGCALGLHLVRTCAVAVSVVATSCGGLGGGRTCKDQYGSYDVEYSGAARGIGKLFLEGTDEQPGVVRVRLELLQGTKEDATVLLALHGIGTCEEGLAQVRFDSMAGENEQFKILGGSMVGVFVPGAVSRPFGQWEMLVLEKERGAQREMAGFWRQLEVTRQASVGAR